jgi:hypothetical protein
MNAHKLLETIQRDAFIHKGIDPSIVQERELEFLINFIKSKNLPKELETLGIEEAKSTLSELPTKYQNVRGYQIMKNIVNDINIVLREVNFGQKEKESNNKKPPILPRLIHFLKCISRKYRRGYKLDSEIHKIIQGVNSGKTPSWKPIPLFGSIDVGSGFSAYLTQGKEPLIVVSGELFTFASVISSIISNCYPCKTSDKGTCEISINKNDWISLLNDDVAR